ncbi:aspartate aminotransferase [Litorimonas taeanensis]|uniref:Aminotransferase n=1 Tax=Litorimonas taeanensis TaxID=568099 RepID=A0A420WDM7_9PROT|nr:amino acid aminotransferase [Litorimonas taeanensis]RKQ69055.1 aspartate aminotransferase [Litorimonas taeanensis]
MFEYLVPRAPDAIMALMEACKADTNPNKIDLGVGVYKNDAGETTVMKAVKEAEKRWWAEEQTKSYVSTVGRADFRDAMCAMMFGEDNSVITEGRLASAQAGGGSGALRLGAEVIKSAAPDATVWVSTPTWANHTPLISSAGLKMENYPYYNRETLGVDFEDMIDHLRSKAKAGDVVLLHGCCHNPTGADLSHEQWDYMAEFLVERNLLPYVDLAYFGLGRGMEDDVYGLRKILATCPEALVAASCSKNFGLYRERVGLIAVVTKDQETAKIAQSQLGSIQRKIISMPPDHGAALVAKILNDSELRAMWIEELDAMRNRMLDLRSRLSNELAVQGSEVMANAVKAQNGMFSTLPVSKEQAEALRADYSVYMTNSGRINIAGANIRNIPLLAKAILDVL